MNKTPLYETHQSCGAKLVDFAGWSMPLQYSGVIDEYHAIRGQAGLFDVSHMGRLQFSGKGALEFLQFVTTNDVSKLAVRQAQYSMVCNPSGGIKDDVFVYRTGSDTYLLCVNASNREKISQWLSEQKANRPSAFNLQDCSAHMAQLALQGPSSKTILGELLNDDSLDSLKPRWCLDARIFDGNVLITRTGYTGELGYELYLSAERAVDLWKRIMEVGASHGLKPAGLGARDLLRLDMGYFLYGNDLTEETTPVEAGAEWVVGFEKPVFIGSDVLKQQKHDGPAKRLVAFELLEKAVPRHDMGIFVEHEQIGQVTSGNLSPILQKGIGLGYVTPQHSAEGTRFDIHIRGKKVPAVVVKLPFYKRTPSN
ncbi:MAG: glycine cleavage system aminomethyltransferase GcvT [Nitrospirales bacterium]|nr:glycine cleavage system aminomethyltransferase GcvT [Nitrospira sp.]MDR4500706.1 glycine cleavage system aminomethyltransferase GcvT [Nitrospirales bacterium]